MPSGLTALPSDAQDPEHVGGIVLTTDLMSVTLLHTAFEAEGVKARNAGADVPVSLERVAGEPAGPWWGWGQAQGV